MLERFHRWEVRCDWARPSINPYIQLSEGGVVMETHWSHKRAERARRWYEAQASHLFGGAYYVVARRGR